MPPEPAVLAVLSQLITADPAPDASVSFGRLYWRVNAALTASGSPTVPIGDFTRLIRSHGGLLKRVHGRGNRCYGFRAVDPSVAW